MSGTVAIAASLAACGGSSNSGVFFPPKANALESPVVIASEMPTIGTPDAVEPEAVVPTAVRIEIQKFAHVFREGSSIRVTIDSPSQTGYWLFDKNKTVSRNPLLHDPLHASGIALGYIGYPHAELLPSCDKTIRQPCRPNEVDVPAGVGPSAPIRAAAFNR